MSAVRLPEMVASFGRTPECAGALERLNAPAAIWCGSGDEEMAGGVEPALHVLSFALTRYDCEPVADGRALGRLQWRPGMAQLMPAGVAPKGVFYTPWRLLHLYLPHEALATLLEVEMDRLALIDPAGRDDPSLSAAGLAIAQALGSNGAGQRLRLESAVLAIVLRLGERWSNLARPVPTSRGGLAPWQLKRACEAMMASLDDVIGLDQLAAIVGCSPTHFSRAFKQSTGLAPFHWLAERRIERAKALLEDNRLPLAEIALAVGFSAQPQFTTAFGRATGVTPARWRRERLG